MKRRPFREDNLSDRIASAAALAMTLGLVACNGDSAGTSSRPSDAAGSARSEAVSDRFTASSDETVVARVETAEISLADIEAPLAFALHDLAMQRYRLLRRSLLAAALDSVEGAPGASRIGELFLEPPMPPRLEVEADPARVRPSGDAPVTVLAFCSFESPHCGRLQIKLADVLPLFRNVVRFAALDLPLPFHRNAGMAAEASRCALAQGNYWRFHDALYAGSGELDRERLDGAARTALLDVDDFDACLESGRWSAEVAADAARAAELGIAVVPAVFVNGLYASPEVEPSDLIWLIEQELARLGVPSPRGAVPSRPTTAPLVLRSLLYSEHAGQGVALLSPAAMPGRGEVFGEGSALASAVVVERITSAGVELLNAGVPERLGFDAESAGSAALPPAISDAEEPVVVTPHRAVPVTLERQEVLIRLADRVGLQEVLATVPMTAGGYHQLRITEVQPGSLFELLGLEAGDVILGVNEQPVHEADNPLWDALEREDEVRVRVMRRGGVAQHYTYQFDE